MCIHCWTYTISIAQWCRLASFSGDPGFIQSLDKVSVHTCRSLSFGKGSIVEMALYAQGKSCLPSHFAMLQFVPTPE